MVLDLEGQALDVVFCRLSGGRNRPSKTKKVFIEIGESVKLGGSVGVANAQREYRPGRAVSKKRWTPKENGTYDAIMEESTSLTTSKV